MKNITIYTNGKSLFTLRNYDKTAGVSHVHGITIYSEVSELKMRQMHYKGQLHYIEGIGDRKVLAGVELNRNMELENFKIW